MDGRVDTIRHLEFLWEFIESVHARSLFFDLFLLDEQEGRAVGKAAWRQVWILWALDAMREGLG